MKIIISLVLLVATGCEQYSGVYIDESCSMREHVIIEDAVRKYNAAVPEDYAIDIVGTIDASSDDLRGVGPSSRDVIKCYPQDTKEPSLDGLSGRIDNDDILLRSTENDDYYIKTVMHELAHQYAGARHVANSKSVMYQYRNGATEYTSIDLAEINRTTQ